MGINLKPLFVLSVVLIFLLGINLSVLADYPEGPITIVVPWGEGGITDLTNRALVSVLEDKIDQSIIIENRAGASGAVGAMYVVGAKPDGYTLLGTSGTTCLFQVLGTADLSLQDFELIKPLTMGVQFVTVQKDAPWDTIQEFVKYARENPDELTCSHAGPGTSGQVANLLIESLGVEINDVSFGGGGPAVTALLGGHVDVCYQSATAVIEYVRSGDLKILGSFTNEPLSFAPDVTPIGKVYPELAENFPWGFPIALVAPKGTPEEVINKLAKAIDEATKSDEWKEFTKNMMIMDISNEFTEVINKWQSFTTWLIYEGGIAENSPAKFGIPEP